MNEPDGFQVHTPFYLCMMADEQDEALADVMTLAQPDGECGLGAALDALAEIHQLVKSYLGA
ncbi:hypothetical protein [Paraburkholderia azotifigens]|uniref:Uncharacterized protein n=1 Tax=Paraburkholderia azotifigens TaxID=2057004 RepID=A0A5C6V6T9_9BURK|nr:hypothetical protein [Paraburkholderia azotifigens]TXC80943.1 hypothetical protein FRZ40_42835 [Paraburkholderia azotifigens]